MSAYESKPEVAPTIIRPIQGALGNIRVEDDATITDVIATNRNDPLTSTNGFMINVDVAFALCFVITSRRTESEVPVPMPPPNTLPTPN